MIFIYYIKKLIISIIIFMDIIYGVSIDYDIMLTILQKVYNDTDFDINTGDYKEYTEELNNYINKNLKIINLKIFSTAQIEAESSNNFWTIGYRVSNIGYYADLSIPVLSEQIKLNIEKDYIKFCKFFKINKQKFNFIIMIDDNNLIV
jgi:hypothetical protein